MIPTLSGQLRSSPYVGQLMPCMASPAVLDSETDFTSMALMARRRWAPVLLSFAQRHDLMSRVIATIDEVLGDAVERILLHARVPAGGRMPANLARPSLFIVADLEPEIERLKAAGFSFLSIRDGIVRHPLEIGHNELEMTWQNAPADGAARFADLRRNIAGLGFDVTLEPAR
jgi:hypothetical protein